MKKLVLLIHGLGGDADGTWQKFPELVRADADLADQYDVKTFEYDTGAFGSKPSLAKVAAILKTEIENRYPAYSDIALIAHSQGGLVARYYIAERLNSGQPLRVSRLLTFATPHQGSGLATWLSRVPLASQQTEDLDPNSEFLQALAVAWGQAKADRRVLNKYVVAAGDAVVGRVSAMGPWSPGYEVVGGDGHLAVVKPKTVDHTSFLIAKKFLLEDSLLPGGVEADYRAPLLRFNHVDAGESTRFIYSARVLPFIGRDAEIDILADFLGGPEQPFRWMVMYGSGGVGKSRLALELCLAVRSEWHAGFVPQDGQEPDWGRWQPLLPTLIVVDYAARDTERTEKLLRALAGRGPADGTARLAAPVRVLLIERMGGDDNEGMGRSDWLNKVMGFGTTEAQVKAARGPTLELTTIDNPWLIFESVLKEKNKPLPDKTETLAALAGIDPERRPLFAYFAADAIAHGDDIRQFNREQLLAQVIKRNRKGYWDPAGATPKDERLLAVATMAGGLPVGALEGVTEKLLPSWDIERHPAIFLAMTGQESGENIAPLEPDIVGEHFTLACLAQTNLSNKDRARLCALAWLLNPLGMAQFMERAHRDLAGHAMLRWVRKSPPSEGPPQFLWTIAAYDVAIDLGPRDPAAAQALLGDMRGVADARGEAALWAIWAKATFNLIVDLGSRDPKAARSKLDEMHGVACARDEAFVWEQWAKAGTNLMNDLASFNPVVARKLLDEMRRVAAARGEAALWEPWASASFNLMHGLRLRPDAARDLLDEMRRVADARGEAALWDIWAKAAFNLMHGLRSRDPDAARDLLDKMCDVADARGEAALAKAARALFAKGLAVPPEFLQRLGLAGR